MSSKKDKLIESATKFIVKGQIDRAIKEYEQVVALDPNDLRNRQKLAELLVRVNRKQEAIEEFEKIGKYYANNAYYLKAIAVYTQIQKLDPANISVVVALAEMNVKQGLEGNAIQKYNEALVAYEREGKHEESAKVLESMLAAFPENPNIRLKAAEYHLKTGKTDESYQEFTELALIMHRKGNDLAFQQVCDKIQASFPDRTDFFFNLAEASLNKGDASGSLQWFRKVIAKDRQNRHVWDLYVAALTQTKQRDQLHQAYTEMLLLFPDSPVPAEGLIGTAIDEGCHDEALKLLIELRDRIVAADRVTSLEQSYQRLADLLPGDLRVLEGLRDLYTFIGNMAELAVVESKIASLSGAVAETASVAEIPTPPPVPEPQIAVESARYEWEGEGAGEELDLSSLDDGQPFEIESTSLVKPVSSPEPAVVTGEEDTSFAVNWDSEGLDLGDIELVGGPLEGLDVAEEISVPAIAETNNKRQAVRVGEELDDSDTETHYSLGIAYKEMGLLDEAIREFKIASKSPERKVDCLTLQGLCLRDKGDLAAAAEAFAGVLKIAAAPAELLCARFELADLHECKGDLAEALRLYREVAKTDPQYREVTAKIAELDKGESGGYLSDQLLELVLDHDD